MKILVYHDPHKQERPESMAELLQVISPEPKDNVKLCRVKFSENSRAQFRWVHIDQLEEA